MPPAEWYGRGVRLLGRTAVECTRDILGDRIGRDISELLAGLPSETRFVVIDPFAGSCNTLYWILRHVPNSEGVAFELDPQVYELSRRNVANLDQSIELNHGDYQDHLRNRKFPTGSVLVFFVAPPWGTALDEATGLDLRRTTPPITEIIAGVAETHPGHKLLFATQVYEKVNAASLADLQRMLDWSDLRVYDLNVEGRNHGVLLGTRGWKPGT
jgi:predicted RNA methylase